MKSVARKSAEKVDDLPASLPKDWRLATLGEVCDFLDHLRIPINGPARAKRILGKSESELYPYFGANGQVGWIDDFIFDEPLVLLAEDGGFFGSHTRPIAYAVTGRCWVNNHAHVLRPKAELVDFDFCYHALRIRPDILEMVAGSTRAKLNRSTAYKIPILLPPLSEQRQIAGRLREQLAAVAQTRAAVQAQLDAAKVLPAAHLRAVFQSEAAQRWPHRRLGDAAEIVGGMQKTPDRAPRQFHKQFLTVRNVQHGRLDLSNVERFEVTETEFARLRLLKGDLLLVEGNGSQSHIGRNALFNEDGEWIHQNHIIRARLNRAILLAEFVSHYLNSTAGRGQLLEKAKTTTGLYTLSTGKIAALEIPTPALDTQRQIAARLDAEKQEAASLTQMLTDKLTALDHLPAALLREAFGGSRSAGL